MKIGILTYHRSINYGSFLQAYCLAKFVQKTVGNRAKVEIINYSSLLAYRSYNRLFIHNSNKLDEWKKRIGFERSLFLLPLSKGALYSDDMSKIEEFLKNQKYDVVIVGSDEVWKVDGMRGFPTAYWLNFDLGSCEKIAYAVSSRTALNKIDQKKKDYITHSVKQFRYLGVRDQMTLDSIHQISGEIPDLNCDPAILVPFHYNRNVYKEKIYTKYHIDKNQKLLGIMISDPKLIQRIRTKLGNQYKIVALFNFHEDADISMVGINPFEWVKVIGCLDFLVTDRFHGTVFAMKMGTPFLSIETYDAKENSKIYYLLNSNGLDEHYIVYRAGNTIYTEILDRITQLLEQDDSKRIQYALNREKAKSESFKKELLKIVNEHLRNIERRPYIGTER